MVREREGRKRERVGRRERERMVRRENGRAGGGGGGGMEEQGLALSSYCMKHRKSRNVAFRSSTRFVRKVSR